MQPLADCKPELVKDLTLKQKKNKSTINWLTASTVILLVVFLLIVIVLLYTYHSFQPYIQDLIKSGKIPPPAIMKLLFKPGTIFVD